ncbi:MAG: hypothetical protein PUB24_00630 [Lachnospiraceae bacterium]|nr:hypothetical protein [Lachnospiraceae bacterium]MDD6191572.1 hypothetical protein [Lachnospiraceae bacterium]MDY4793241.1 hypothetical protein [Pararoseburia sp.]
MDKIQKEKMQKETSPNSILKEKLIIAFSSVFEALFLLLELYFMIHSRENFVALIVVAICMILVLFFLVMAIIDLNQKIKNMEWKEYQDIYKAQKASYLSTKKAFDEIGQRLSALEEGNSFPAEDIISAQKAVAKVTISRNKENAEALMNANDELIQRVFGFEEKLADNKEELMKLQQEIMQQTKDEMSENQKNIQTQFDTIQSLLQQVQQGINLAEVKTTDFPEAPQAEMQQDIQMDLPEESLPKIDEADIIDEDEPVVDTEDLEMPVEDELPSLDDIELPEGDELPNLDDIELPEEDELPNLDDIELPVEDELPSLDDVDVPEADEEEAPEELPMPDLSDPNKTLSPDEIAALFSNAESVAAPEPEEEQEPEVEVEMEPMPETAPEEEKPPMPDLSDPNKTLSPDEIAALFANM